MNVKTNKELALRFLRAMAEANVGDMDELLAEDATIWVLGSSIVSGAKEKQDYLRQFAVVEQYISLPVRMSFAAVTAEDDRVCVAASSNAELKNGATYANEYHFLIRIRDGHIVSVKEYMDTEAASRTFEPMFRPLMSGAENPQGPPDGA